MDARPGDIPVLALRGIGKTYPSPGGEVHALRAVDDWQALGDGYRVELRIVVDERKDELRAPVGALFRRGEGWAAFVVRDGRAREVAVQVGRATPGFAEVLGGLAAGDVAVLYPRELMVDGAPVRPQGARRSLPNADYPCGTARRTVAPRRTRRR
ncbi:MAG: hypothetical protein FJ306_11050 [Planctomycetes bacterium]|nr:hypothetical protein [Planctomycetota bacterium]